MCIVRSKWNVIKIAVSYIVIFSTSIRAVPPLALHQLIEVDPGGEVVLMLHGHDLDGDEVSSKCENNITN